MALPVFRNSQVTNLSGSTGVTSGAFAEPSGIANGYFEIARVTWFNTATGCSISGWAPIGTGVATQSNSGLKTAWFAITRGASAPSLTVSFTGGVATFANVLVGSWSGATGIEAIGVITPQSGFTSAPAITGATTSLTDSLAIGLYSIYQGTVSAVSAGWTLDAQGIVQKGMAVPGATGNATLTNSQSSWMSGLMIGLASVAIPVPKFIGRPAITGAPGVGKTLTCVAATKYAYTVSYQWQRRNGSSWVSIGTNSATYVMVSGDSKLTVRCTPTATGGGGSTSASTLGVSFYTLASLDTGHDITADVTRTNTASSTTVSTAAITVQLQPSTPPSISGGSPMSAGTVLTAVAGTWAQTVSSRTYQWLSDGTQVATGTTFTPGEEYGSRRITVREVATGPSGSGTAVSTAYRFFPAMTIPWGTDASIEDQSPFLTPLPADAPVDPTWTTTLQGYLNAAGRNWWFNGGNHGPTYSAPINIVDSSMARTSWILVQSGASAETTATKNGGIAPHLAWSWKTKNGGVPTPPGGFIVAPGSDHHIIVYCRDTFEWWEGWSADLTNFTSPRIAWGSYIPDVRKFIGYCQDLNITPGTTDEKQYSAWGSTAAFPIPVGLVTTRELTIDGAVEHAIPVQLYGNNHTARYPSLRTEGTVTSSLPLGGIWRIDPTFDLTSLPTLGSTAADNFRLMIMGAFQKYGAVNNDSTGGDNAIRIEAVANAADAYQLPVSFDTVFRSVPITAWQMLKDTYRPAGVPAAPPNPKLSTLHFTSTDLFYKFGSYTFDTAGRVTIGGQFGALVRTLDPYDVTSDTTYVRLVQANNSVKIGIGFPTTYEDNIAEFDINTNTGLIKAHVTVGTTTSGTDTSATYSSSTHAWLRFRHAAGHLFFETAEDLNGTPTSWTTFRDFTIPGTFWDLEGAYFQVYSPYSDVTPGSGTAVVTNLNMIPAPVATSPGVVIGV